MGKKKRLRKQRAENARMRTALGDHNQVGKNLIPPFLNMPGGKMQPSSWMNDRLPEMLWACLIRSAFPQDKALAYFRLHLRIYPATPDGRKAATNLRPVGNDSATPLKNGLGIARFVSKPLLSLPGKFFIQLHAVQFANAKDTDPLPAPAPKHGWQLSAFEVRMH